MDTENPDIFSNESLDSAASSRSGDGKADSAFNEIAQQTREAANDFSRQLKAETRQVLATEKEKFTGELESLSAALRHAGSKLHDERKEVAAKIIETGLDGVERVSEYLRSRDTHDIVSEIEGFVRRRPAIAAGAAVAVGFLISQLIRGGKGAADEPAQKRYLPGPNEESRYGGH